MRARRLGSKSVEPGSTSGFIVIMLGGRATATEFFGPLWIPKAATCDGALRQDTDARGDDCQLWPAPGRFP